MIRKILNAIFIRQPAGGLKRPGDWRVVYPNGQQTNGMPYNAARDYLAIWNDEGLKIVWSPRK